MVVTWSDSERSIEPESKDGQTHLCRMANDDKDDDLKQNHKEVLDFHNSCSKDELVKALFDIVTGSNFLILIFQLIIPKFLFEFLILWLSNSNHL